MTGSGALDLILGLLLLGYAVYGFTNGLLHSIATIAGVIAGVIGAFFLAPIVAGWMPFPMLRPVVTIVTALALVGLGHWVGYSIGRTIRRGVERTPLSAIDRIVGGLATTVVAALVASVVAFSVGQLGVPVLSQAIAGSNVLRVIGAITPDPVQQWLAEVRGYVVTEGIPRITDALGGEPPQVPQIDTGSPALNAAAQSVVRVTGNALQCGQSQTGSGFVVAPDRIVTNAHVVAGVTEPTVEALNGSVAGGRVVYFDPVHDLAVIATDGFAVAPLPLGTNLAPGTDAAVQGYPFGGPFTSSGAEVIAVSTARTPDIYGGTGEPREFYTLAADVREGNSGGPLLSLDGEVAGIVFARSADNNAVGFAMTMTELDPVADSAAGLTTPVSSGDCVRG
jgi:S1-C subfamily serine protease